MMRGITRVDAVGGHPTYQLRTSDGEILLSVTFHASRCAPSLRRWVLRVLERYVLDRLDRTLRLVVGDAPPQQGPDRLIDPGRMENPYQ